MVDSCSEADCIQRIRNQEHKEIEVTNSKIPRQDGDCDEASLSPSSIPSMEDILTACPDESIVSAEILVQLLRIQSKYLDEHPCLCTSRFRHVLHQLDHNQHKKLADLCGQLRLLTSVSSEHLYSTTQYYNTIIQRIFDYESLKVASYVVERSIEYGNDQALSAKLEAILARLVSDYRAIFAIEEKCVIDRHQKTEDTTNAAAGKATEVHRKRHEGEDECPEEIKLMKVAWKDLTLHCPATAMTASPLALGTVKDSFSDPSDQNSSPECSSSTVMARNITTATTTEGPESQECTDFILKYNAIFRSKNQKNEPRSQFSKVLQAKCTSSCKARKRKERQETLVEHDSKFSRSSSETWDDSACDFTDSFRRSQSSVDLDYDGPCCVPSPEIQSDEGKKPRNRFFIDEANEASSGSSNSTLTSSTILGGDADEASQSSLDQDKKKHHSNSVPNAENVDPIKQGTEKTVPPTPTSEPEPSPKIQDTPTSFKFNGWGLHAEVGPIVDQNQEIRPLSWLPPGHENYGSRPSGSLEDDQMYSSRAMGILRYLDPTPMVTQRRSSDPEASKKTKLKHLKKQLSSVRRKLENLQINFEESQGYKPSQADKQGDRNMRRLLLEQSQLQRQIRGYRDCDFLEDLDEGSNDSDKLVGLDLEVESPADDTNSTDGSSGESVQNNNNDNNNSHKSKDLEAMRSTLDEIEECLNYQRTNKGRCVTLDEMTVEQLHDEKVDLHNAIRQFESAYGAPMDEDEKLVVKSLYDRYRTVKRLVRRSSASRAKDTTELETIPEGEALALTLASPPHRINLEFNGSTSTTSPSNGLGKKRYVEDGLPVSKKNTPAEPEAKQPPTSESSGDDYSNDSEGPESKAEEENQRKRLDAEQYHSMSRFDLLQIFRKTREEKKQLRRLIKEKEEEFQKKTGRRLLREDRDKSETAYKQYKVTKAKVKLIEALLAKRAHEPMF